MGQLTPEDVSRMAEKPGIPFGPEEDFEGVPDGRERIPQLVRERGEELVLAAVGLPHGLVHLLALGDVPRDFRSPDHPT